MANPTYQSGFYAPGRGTALHPELWRGCVGAWNPGLGNSGLVLRDWSGNQNNGVLTNGPTWGVSDGRQALSFDGSNDSIDIPHSRSLSNLSAMTVALWINPESITNSPVIIGKSTGTGSWYLQYYGGSLKIYFSDILRGTIGTPTLGAYSHVGFSYDGTSVVPYLDGVKGTATSMTGTVSTGTGIMRIGGYVGGLTYYQAGSFYDVLVSNKAWSASQFRVQSQRPGIAYELAPRKIYSIPVTVTYKAYLQQRNQIIGGGFR
jgi:hypothetical protein